MKKNRKQNDSSRNLSRVDNFLTEISIVTGILVKESPVHADVPDECVTRAGECRHDPDIEESTASTAHLITWLHCNSTNTHGHCQYTDSILTVINIVLKKLVNSNHKEHKYTVSQKNCASVILWITQWNIHHHHYSACTISVRSSACYQ